MRAFLTPKMGIKHMPVFMLMIIRVTIWFEISMFSSFSQMQQHPVASGILQAATCCQWLVSCRFITEM